MRGNHRVGSGDKSETMSPTDCGKQSKTKSSITTATIAKKKRVAGIGGAMKSKTKQPTNTITAKTPTRIMTKRVYRRKKHLPQDLVMEQILSKVPVKILLRCGAVSKSWYNSIHNDKRLTYTHFLQSQRNPDILFNLLNVKDRVTDTGKVKLGSHFFKLTFRPDTIQRDYLGFQRFRTYPIHLSTKELVGYCHGFPCISSSECNNYNAVYTILQIYRGETMYITCTPIVNQRMNNAHIICHGFGFDSVKKEYKLVSVYSTSHKELNLIVFTLGTKSWRDVTTASMPTSVHGLPITRIRAATGKDRPAIFCSNSGNGCLVWKIMVTVGGGGANDNNNEMEMLLLFNLHDEKFQFIQVQIKGTTGEEQKQLLVDYPHLLEFKGYPCIARVEKLLGNNGSDCYNPLRHDHHGSSSCCCCCKIHMYVLKDKVKQVWVKEESFDVCVKPSYSHWYSPKAPDPCCFCFGSTTTPPTRIFCFSDHIFLYWFDGRYLHVFDLRSKSLRVASAYDGYDNGLFIAKMKEPSHTFDDSDDNIYCSNMDYQLHCQGENFLSLQSFVPEGVGKNDIQVLRSWIRQEVTLHIQHMYSWTEGSGEFYAFVIK